MTQMDFAPSAERFAERQLATQSTRTLGAFSIARHNAAQVISNTRPGQYAFFYAPGWHTNGAVIAKNFDRHVSDLGSTHYGVHPPGAYSIDLQKEAWIDARKKDGFRPAKLYAQSKAVLTVSHMFVDPGFRYEFGEVDSVCFDSPATSKHVINPVPYNLMRLGRKIPNHPVAERLCRKAMESMLSDMPDFDPDFLTQAEAKENSAASAQTRLIACISQLEYMWSHDIADFNLKDFGASVPNKKIISASRDALIDVQESASVINRSYGGGFEYRVDPYRRDGSHATGTERPKGVIDALKNQNAEQYQIVEIQ